MLSLFYPVHPAYPVNSFYFYDYTCAIIKLRLIE
jgi:hypothetical protein